MHMVASEYLEVIEGKRWLIATYVLDFEELDEDSSIHNYGTSSNEEYKSGSGEVDVRTCVTQSGTEEVEDVQRVVKYSSLFSYMLKPTYLLTKGFNKNKKSQEISSIIYVILGHEQ